MIKNEEALQINLVNWFKYNYPYYSDHIHHIANERRLEKNDGAEFYYGKKLKKMGVTAGVSDLFIAVPNQKFAGLWLELKDKGKKPSQNQLVFMANKIEIGYSAQWTDNLEKAKQIITDYLACCSVQKSSS